MRTAALTLAALALIAVIAGSAYLAFADTSSGMVCTASPGEATQCVSYSRTLVEDQGAWIITLLLAPIALAGSVLALMLRPGLRAAEIAVAGVLFLLCLISILSIGGFYILGAFLLLIAAALDRGPRGVEA
jgi:hypothetical protein